MNLYKIEFNPMYPVPAGLIILAESKENALKIARETLKHTEPKEVEIVKMDREKVVFYESGDY